MPWTRHWVWSLIFFFPRERGGLFPWHSLIVTMKTGIFKASEVAQKVATASSTANVVDQYVLNCLVLSLFKSKILLNLLG